MEGLGQIGAQAPQQEQGQPQQEAPKFTFEMAGQMNDEIVAKTNASAQAPVQQQKAPQQAPQGSGHSSGLGKIDLGAMKAVEAGVIDPREVLNDPGVSDGAKQEIARGMGLA